MLVFSTVDSQIKIYSYTDANTNYYLTNFIFIADNDILCRTCFPEILFIGYYTTNSENRGYYFNTFEDNIEEHHRFTNVVLNSSDVTVVLDIGHSIENYVVEEILDIIYSHSDVPPTNPVELTRTSSIIDYSSWIYKSEDIDLGTVSYGSHMFSINNSTSDPTIT